MRNNQGFSLIELMVVITILAILISGVGINLRLLSFADTERVTKEVDSALSKLQLETMSQGNQNHYLVLEWDMTKKAYYISFTTSSIVLAQENWATSTKVVKNRKKLASENITITYSDQTDGTGSILLRDANPVLLIDFISSTGAFRSGYKQIVIESNSKTNTLHMVGITGNHYID